MKFIAVDVETANADMASICAIGAAAFEDGQLSSEWYSLVDPDDYFDPVNVSIHGIDERMVAGSPTYRDAASTIERLFCDAVVVTHTHFDRVAIHQAARRWTLEPPRCNWLDSAKAARRAWAECARSGYGLADACKRIGYKLRPHNALHNALEDAKAAGHVLLAAMSEMGLDLEGILRRVRLPIDPSSASSGAIKRTGNPDGSLFGEVVVFTGALEIPRREAADLAAVVGCEVAPGVTKATTLLVVGDLDVKRLAGHQKSSKHRKAEELIAKGFPIRIIRETDFREFIGAAQDGV
ncbi:MAG: 3'-5' exoribonuclease [Candidatus Tectomicrobia bacterium]|uniref:3'-5' exoribonuclease n=1 Tax=Tectimicrobiota bacterium TaxID=2528274 RepID=A0A932MNP0_UNCTE|nr:3'-5' exoribonuclease [Candidatus Tectomicrobia bacterium]